MMTTVEVGSFNWAEVGRGHAASFLLLISACGSETEKWWWGYKIPAVACHFSDMERESSIVLIQTSFFKACTSIGTFIDWFLVLVSLVILSWLCVVIVNPWVVSTAVLSKIAVTLWSEVRKVAPIYILCLIHVVFCLDSWNLSCCQQKKAKHFFF